MVVNSRTQGWLSVDDDRHAEIPHTIQTKPSVKMVKRDKHAVKQDAYLMGHILSDKNANSSKLISVHISSEIVNYYPRED